MSAEMVRVRIISTKEVRMSREDWEEFKLSFRFDGMDLECAEDNPFEMEQGEATIEVFVVDQEGKPVSPADE